jgi:hypothetical protein
MSRIWFTYCDLSGRLLGVLILDSPSLLKARERAAVLGTSAGSPYCEGYELDRESADLIPIEVIGRMLKPEEVRNLIRKLERGIPKRAAAASVRRRGSVRTRAKR